MYRLPNRFASAREVNDVRHRNTTLELQVANLTSRLSELERKYTADRERDLKEKDLLLRRAEEAEHQLAEAVLENSVFRGQVTVLKQVVVGQGGQVDGGSEDDRDAVGSLGDDRQDDLHGGGGHTGGSGDSSATTGTNNAFSSGSGSSERGSSGKRESIDRTWLIWTLVDKFFFNGIVGLLTNWGGAWAASRMHSTVPQDTAVALGKVLQQASRNYTGTVVPC